MRKLKFIPDDTKEAKRFALGCVMSGAFYLVHPQLGRIVLGLTIAGSTAHIIDRVVDVPEKANKQNDL